jgi:hypothetical protein
LSLFIIELARVFPHQPKPIEAALIILISCIYKYKNS